MSFDLEIVTNQKPVSENVKDFFSSRKGLKVDGELNGQASNLLITRQTRKENHPCFTIDGPFRVELDGLQDEVVSAVLDPRWLTQISVPYGASEKDLNIAIRLAGYIADTWQGAVYDPQEDKVIWPKRRQQRYVAPVEEQRIRLVGVEWFLPMSQSSSNTPRTLLNSLRRICPEALPTRFGTCEPPQHRLETDEELFIGTWESANAVEWGDSFFWRSKSPCYGGHICFPDRRDQYKPEGAERAVHLSMNLDGRALTADSRWCETVVSLTLELARKLKAFYALGYVQRNVIARRGIWFDGKSEPSPTLPGKWWLGLPQRPAWLVWFGAGYAEVLQANLEHMASAITPDGMLLRFGQKPMDSDELTGVFPLLPRFLIAREEGETHKPAQEIPRLG